MSQAAPAKEKKVSDKDVDLSTQKRDVWLVKVPKYIADRWESEDGGTPVGKISIKPGQPGSGGPEVLFKLSENISKERPAPRLRRRLPSPKTTTGKTMAKLQAQTFTSGQLQTKRSPLTTGWSSSNPLCFGLSTWPFSVKRL